MTVDFYKGCAAARKSLHNKAFSPNNPAQDSCGNEEIVLLQLLMQEMLILYDDIISGLISNALIDPGSLMQMQSFLHHQLRCICFEKRSLQKTFFQLCRCRHLLMFPSSCGLINTWNLFQYSFPSLTKQVTAGSGSPRLTSL